MEKIMAVLETVNGWVNNFVWGVPVLLLILGTGIFYTIRLGFLQFRHPVFLFRETVDLPLAAVLYPAGLGQTVPAGGGDGP